MKLIPHHQDDKHGTREYRLPDGPGESCGPAAPEEAGTRGRAGRSTSAARAAAPAGVITPPSSAGRPRWSSWTPRPQHRGARASRQRSPSGARSRTTSTRPLPDREARRAGDLPEVPTVPIGGPPPPAPPPPTPRDDSPPSSLGTITLTARPSAPGPGCSARPRSTRRTPPAGRAQTATPPTASAGPAPPP